MKKTLSLITCLVLVVSLAVPVAASLQYTYIDTLYSAIDFDSFWGVANCYGTVESMDDYEMKIVVSLQQYNESTGFWDTLRTWSETGYHYVYVNESYAVARGAEIRLYTTAYVYDTDGTIIEVASQIY